MRLWASRLGSKWALAAVLVAVLGIASAAFVAKEVSRSEARRTRAALQAGGAQVTSQLRLALAREEDLVVSGRALIAANPSITKSEFDQWASSIEALSRYPELMDLGLIVRVPAGRLPQFSREMLRDPVLPMARQPIGTRGRYEVFPPGTRPAYCLAYAGVVREATATLPPALDYCALAPELWTARDTGTPSYAPFYDGSRTTLAIQTPIYRALAPTRTTAERRSAFLGWLAELIVPSVLLSSALHGHPGQSVALSEHSGGATRTFVAGANPGRGRATTTHLAGSWTVTTYEAEPKGGLTASARADTLLATGTIISLLVAALIWVLGTSRSHALKLVGEKTRELESLATHDGLTGLANRALLVERADRMLERSRQGGAVPAVLYVDLDGFKEVNDTLGHAAGDQVLTVVAQRLQQAVRKQDMVARFGGDEFVVLIETRPRDDTPMMLAGRIIEAVSRPISVGDAGAPITVGASVGIAVGHRASSSQLLRDSDLALYSAKASGRSRYAVYEHDTQAEAVAVTRLSPTSGALSGRSASADPG